MKKIKILVPALTLSALGGVTLPLAACSKGGGDEPVIIPETLNIDADGNLLGFKSDATEEDIQKQFGDTLIIPKNVKKIADNAFVHDQFYSTIPDFIENFKFEDEYSCTEIGRGAFRFAPFKTVSISCQRNVPDGERHPDNWFYLPDNAWGLKTLGSRAFFQNTRLETVKLPATITSFESSTDAFSCYDGFDYVLTLKTIDMSDWAFADPKGSSPDGLTNCFHMDGRESWEGKMIIRGFDGIYGPYLNMGENAKKLQFLNQWQEKWGAGYVSGNWDESEWKLNSSGTSVIEWMGDPNPIN